MGVKYHEAMKGTGRISVIAAVLAALVSVLATAPAEARTTVPPRPNIVVVMTDDQAFSELRAMTLTQEWISNQGAAFENFYVSYALCCPSRAAFLSGQYSHNNGVLGNEALAGKWGGYQALRNKRNLLPMWLTRAGYRTAHIGKYLNQYGTGPWGTWNDPNSIPPGWTEWMAAPASNAYRMYDYRLNINGRMRSYGSTEADYQTDVYRRLATNFITRSAKAKRRFFLSVAPLAPHAERSEDGRIPPRPAPRHEGTDVPSFIPSDSFNEDDVSDKPSWLQERPPLNSSEVASLETLNEGRMRSLLAVDEMVKAIHDRLFTLGLLERTYIIFTSDNGYLFGEHRLTGKNWHYQEATQVPLLIRGPGVVPGSEIDAMAANVDLAPTIAEMARVKPGLDQDGVSLMPLLRGETDSVRNDLLFESFESHSLLDDGTIELFGPGTHRGVRTSRYSYIQYFDGSRELYDNQTDPFQLVNLYDPNATGDQATLQSELAARLRILANCSGSRCR